MQCLYDFSCTSCTIPKKPVLLSRPESLLNMFSNDDPVPELHWPQTVLFRAPKLRSHRIRVAVLDSGQPIPTAGSPQRVGHRGPIIRQQMMTSPGSARASFFNANPTLPRAPICERRSRGADGSERSLWGNSTESVGSFWTFSGTLWLLKVPGLISEASELRSGGRRHCREKCIFTCHICHIQKPFRIVSIEHPQEEK